MSWDNEWKTVFFSDEKNSILTALTDAVAIGTI